MQTVYKTNNLFEYRKRRKAKIVEKFLNKIRNNDGDLRSETMGDLRGEVEHDFLDQVWQLGKNRLSKEYLKLLKDHYRYDSDEDILMKHIKKIKDQVDELALEIEAKRSDLDDNQKLEIMDQLWDIRKESHNGKITDQITVLENRILNEKSPEYVALLETRIELLRQQFL